mmetsp:Transcript_66997/g.195884  ORF Transcript_66997/g.195884 Transcript_66997/m.195884 type:complete len:201 (-) Transcript_66997:535-1137(-)
MRRPSLATRTSYARRRSRTSSSRRERGHMQPSIVTDRKCPQAVPATLMDACLAPSTASHDVGATEAWSAASATSRTSRSCSSAERRGRSSNARSGNPSGSEWPRRPCRGGIPRVVPAARVATAFWKGAMGLGPVPAASTRGPARSCLAMAPAMPWGRARSKATHHPWLMATACRLQRPSSPTPRAVPSSLSVRRWSSGRS